MKLKVGEIVPIYAQLADGNQTAKVRAIIVDAHGVQLAALPLYHAEGGLYFSREFKMPDSPAITAQISVEGNDANGEPYAKGAETFFLDTAPEKIFEGDLFQKARLDEPIIEGARYETTFAK